MYNLQITDNQAKIIKVALEEYCRLRMNQWSDFADDVASDNFIYNKDDPENSKKFDEYIDRRNEAKVLFEEAMRTAQPSRVRGEIQHKTEEMMVAEDIWQVIRHQLYLDRAVKNGWCVDARDPIQISKEPLPEMMKLA